MLNVQKFTQPRYSVEPDFESASTLTQHDSIQFQISPHQSPELAAKKPQGKVGISRSFNEQSSSKHDDYSPIVKRHVNGNDSNDDSDVSGLPIMRIYTRDAHGNRYEAESVSTSTTEISPNNLHVPE